MERFELQKNLEAIFTWTARFNMNEAVSNHFSACSANSTDSFYVNRARIKYTSKRKKDATRFTAT